MQPASALIARLVKKLFGAFGLKVSRATPVRPLAGKYFNTGLLSPQEENSETLYDAFYGDLDAVEDYYGSERVSFYKKVVDEVQRRGLNLDGLTVADVGCGIGYLLQEIKSRYTPLSLSGFDFSAQAIEHSTRRFPNVQFKVHDIYEDLGIKADVIFCTEVLEHLELPHKALKRLLNGLSASGQVVLTVPNGRLDSLNEHINFWSPESWKAFLERECVGYNVQTSLLNNGEVNFAIVTSVA